MTSAQNSWPMTTSRDGSRVNGARRPAPRSPPLSAWVRACRSEPQIPHARVFTSTSPDPGSGSGSVSTTSWEFRMTAARMLQFSPLGPRGARGPRTCHKARMADAVDELIGILDLEELEVNIFRGCSPDEKRQRVFGGQVAGQALIAAGRTVARGSVHSLHAYFLRPGDPAKPILYEVDRIRDGRTFTTRRVVAIQHGKAIFNLAASFQPDETGPEHQIAMPEAPDPDTLPPVEEHLAELKDSVPREVYEWRTRARPITVRPVVAGNPFKPTKRPPRQLVWIRASRRLPDDPLLQQCVVAYAAGLPLVETATLPPA